MCNYFPHRKENLTFVRKNNRQIQHDETVFTLFLFVAEFLQLLDHGKPPGQ